MFLRGKTYWFMYRHKKNGVVLKKYQESLHTNNWRLAVAKFKQRKAQIDAGIAQFSGPQIEQVIVDELAELLLRDYRNNERKSYDDVEARWRRHLKPVFGAQLVVDVTSDMVEKYRERRLGENATPATINRELAALRRMFRLGQATTPPKVIHFPKITLPKEHNKRTGYVEDAQYTKLAAECDKVGLWLRAMFEVGYNIGWRVSELLTMRVKQFNPGDRVLRLDPGTTKNDEGREAPADMSETMYALLLTCRIGKGENDYLFTRDGKRDRQPIKDFRGVWSKVTTAAGVPDLHFHDLRRTAARNLRRAGESEGVIMAICGWETREVFERYNIKNRADGVEAARKLQNYRREQAATSQREVDYIPDYNRESASMLPN